MTTKEFMEQHGWEEHANFYAVKTDTELKITISKGAAPLFHQLYLTGQIKSLRKVKQHEKDVWGASRNKSYIDAETAALIAQLEAVKKESV